MKKLACLVVFLSGCASPWSGSSAGGSSLAASAKGAASSGYDPVLSFVAAACLLAGVAALVVTKGQLGARAVVVGLGLVVLNYVLASWGAWLFIPVLVATGAVSLAYAYVIVRRLLKMRKD